MKFEYLLFPQHTFLRHSITKSNNVIRERHKSVVWRFQLATLGQLEKVVQHLLPLWVTEVLLVPPGHPESPKSDVMEDQRSNWSNDWLPNVKQSK